MTEQPTKIEGFKVALKREELLRHLEKRAIFHADFASDFEKKHGELAAKKSGAITQAEIEQIAADLGMDPELGLNASIGGYGGPRMRRAPPAFGVAGTDFMVPLLAELRRQQIEQAGIAEEFTFYAAHLPQVDVFYLDHKAILGLELVGDLPGRAARWGIIPGPYGMIG